MNRVVIVSGISSCPAKRAQTTIVIEPVIRMQAERLFIKHGDNLIIHDISFDGQSTPMADMRGLSFSFNVPDTHAGPVVLREIGAAVFRCAVFSRLSIRVSRVNVTQRPVYRIRRRGHRLGARLAFETVGNCTSRRGHIAMSLMGRVCAGDDRHDLPCGRTP